MPASLVATGPTSVEDALAQSARKVFGYSVDQFPDMGIRELQEAVPQNDDELHHWVKEILGVESPRKACCSGHRAPFEAFADAYFARAPISIWKASRGFGGKSFLLGLLSIAMFDCASTRTYLVQVHSYADKSASIFIPGASMFVT